MRSNQMLKLLLSSKLGIKAQSSSGGSHRKLRRADGRTINWAFHNRELSSLEVKRVLVNQAGLTLDEARKAVQRG